MLYTHIDLKNSQRPQISIVAEYSVHYLWNCKQKLLKLVLSGSGDENEPPAKSKHLFLWTFLTSYKFDRNFDPD